MFYITYNPLPNSFPLATRTLYALPALMLDPWLSGLGFPCDISAAATVFYDGIPSYEISLIQRFRKKEVPRVIFFSPPEFAATLRYASRFLQSLYNCIGSLLWYCFVYSPC